MKLKVLSHILISCTLFAAFIAFAMFALTRNMINQVTLQKEVVATLARQVSDLRFLSAEYRTARAERPLSQWDLGMLAARSTLSSPDLGPDARAREFRAAFSETLDRLDSFFYIIRTVEPGELRHERARQGLLEAERETALLLTDFNSFIGQNVALKQYRANFVWIFGLMVPLFVLLFVLVVLIPRKILFPIEEFGKAVKEVARGNLTYEFKFISDDEFGDLANSFRLMIDRLAEAKVLSMKEIEELRSEKRDLTKTNRLLLDREIAMVELKKQLEEKNTHDSSN